VASSSLGCLDIGQIGSLSCDSTDALTPRRQDFVLTSLHRPILPPIGPRLMRKHRNKFSRHSGGIQSPMSFPFRDGDVDGPAAARRAIDIIEKQVGAENLAAVVIEPIQGEGGFIVPAPGFLSALVDWCRDNGVVFVADEVQTGFARTGEMFACDHEAVVPDLIVTAKGIAGGLPLSAVTGRADIMDAPHVGGLGGTYGGNPLACAAALAVIDTIECDGLIDRGREIEKIMLERLTAIQAGDPRIGDVRGRGAMIAVELVKPGTTNPDADLTKRIAATAHARGLVVLTCGTHGNVLRFLPPLSIPDHLLHEGLGVLTDTFKETR
jgi:4-aminobutyrate aminotransferase / (S)-3-amino-2-methylpropionate transaminase / 5-aminovalerate transaminase